MKKIIKTIILIVVIICIGKVSFKYYQYYKDSKEYSKIQTIKPKINTYDDNVEVDNTSYDDDIKVDNANIENKFSEEELLNINSDYKMWISVNNSNIDYPVVQGEDNDFYLTHSFDKNKNISGCLYIDSNNDIDTDENIVIYGHHMKNETMFHNLNYFKEEEFFKENKINIIRNGRQYKYEPFSVYVIPEDEAVFNMDFIDDDIYKEYLYNLSSKSYFSSDINLDENSEIITLITCSYEYSGARTVVHGIRYS